MTTILSPHAFQVLQSKISIVDAWSAPDLGGLVADGALLVYVTVGPGETHVAVLDHDAKRHAQWTAIFGWSSLFSVPVREDGGEKSISTHSQLQRALSGKLRQFGRDVDTATYCQDVTRYLQSALAYILDETVGSASDYDSIVLAAPHWLQPSLQKCLTLRPHINPEIQDA